jgi:prepilin-type N-terminal cleavage/methylation domain-containing protein
MKNPHLSTSRRGFSLVELLVVIAIVAVLAGVAYGPIMKTVRDARIETGNKMANELVFAIEQFEQAYDYLPYIGDSAPDDVVEYSGDEVGQLLEILMGKEASPDLNPKNTQFFSTDEASNGVNGIEFIGGDVPAALYDPFGNEFTIIIDYSGDNKIDIGQTKFSGHASKTAVVRKVAIAGSEGPDFEFYDGSNDEDDVTSF